MLAASLAEKDILSLIELQSPIDSFSREVDHLIWLEHCPPLFINALNIFMGKFDFLSIHPATPSLEDYEQAYIVHTGFAGWKPTSNHANYCWVL